MLFINKLPNVPVVIPKYRKRNRKKDLVISGELLADLRDSETSFPYVSKSDDRPTVHDLRLVKWFQSSGSYIGRSKELLISSTCNYAVGRLDDDPTHLVIAVSGYREFEAMNRFQSVVNYFLNPETTAPEFSSSKKIELARDVISLICYAVGIEHSESKRALHQFRFYRFDPTTFAAADPSDKTGLTICAEVIGQRKYGDITYLDVKKFMLYDDSRRNMVEVNWGEFIDPATVKLLDITDNDGYRLSFDTGDRLMNAKYSGWWDVITKKALIITEPELDDDDDDD